MVYVLGISTGKHLFAKGTFWGFFCVNFIVLFLWLLAFWPGVMTHDSLQSWSQALTGEYTNWHPYLYSMYVKFLTLFYRSPASVAIFQMLSLSALSAYVFGRLYALAQNKKLIFISFLLLLTSIPVGLLTITLWKDVIYSQLVLLWGIVIFFLIKDNRIISSKRLVIALGLLLFFTSVMRHNGVVLLLIVPAFFYFNKLLNKKNLSIFCGVAIGSYILSQTLLPLVLNVNMNDNNLLKESVKIQIISGILGSNYYEPISQSLEPIYALLPQEEMKKNYDCRTINSILFNKNLKPELLDDKKYKSSFNSIFYQLAIHNIPIVMADRTCVVTSLFIGSVHGSEYYNVLDHIGPYPDFPDNLGLKQNIKLPKLNSFLRELIESSSKFPHNLVFYSLPISLSGFVIGLFYFLKKDRAITNYALFLLSQLPIIFVVLPGPDFRYLYFLYLGFLFYIPMCIVIFANRKEE